MSFADMLLNDAAIFLADFGEQVIYTPFGGTPKTIQADVRRLPVEVFGTVPGANRRNFEMYVSRHPTTGVSVINRSGDTVQVAEVQGGSKMLTMVVQFPEGEQDPGMWRLKLS